MSRELNEPIVEWTDNKSLMIGAFPDKFLFGQGQGVPNRLPTQRNWKHFSLYYDGQFDDPLFKQIITSIILKILQPIHIDQWIQLMWLSGRPMLLVAEVRVSIPAKHRGWSRH